MEQDELEVIVGTNSGLDMEVRISSGFELEEFGFKTIEILGFVYVDRGERRRIQFLHGGI